MDDQKAVKLPRPMGARVLVKDIITSLSIEERAKRSNLYVVTDEESKPRPTMGKVVAVGTDPFLVENGIKEGVTVFFNWHAGTRIYLEDEEFRSLEFQDILSIL